MNIGSEKYKQYADAHAPKSRVVRNSLMAFLFGGLICAVAEALTRLYVTFGMARDDAGLLTSVTLIFVAAVLTAALVFYNIAIHIPICAGHQQPPEVSICGKNLEKRKAVDSAHILLWS